MRNLTLTAIIQVCGGEYRGPVELLKKEISFITTDSRKAGKDCLFAAIRGEKSDGHDYIQQAAASGALCCLGERLCGESPIIVVPSTETALQSIAAFYRMQYNIPFVGVTGSVGKTTAKEMIASVLSKHFNVLKTQKNFNNELGVPLTLFSLRDEHEAAVVEMGISNFGEMRRLTAMVRPDIAVFTAIGESHLENLGDKSGVLRAKMEILEGVGPKGVAIFNGDDDYLYTMATEKATLSYGLDSRCDIRAENVRLNGTDGMSCDIIGGGRKIKADIHAFGSHLAYAALAAASVGMLMGLSDSEIESGIAAYETVGSRSRVVKTDKYTVIDDCYNANPVSVMSALRSLKMVDSRKVAVLGDMLELGKDTRELHRQTGSQAAQSGIDMLLTCGELAADICAGAKAGGLHNALHFETKEELTAALPELLKAGDAVLIKASHGMHFETLVALISAD